MQSLHKRPKITYLVLPDIVFNNPKISYIAAKVYAFIHNFRMEEFFYGNEKLMELFNCSEDSISRAIKTLEDEGFIKTRFDGRKRFIEDSFRLRKIADAESAEVRTVPEAGDSAKVRMLNEASTAGPNNNNNINNNNLQENFEEKFEDWKQKKKDRKEKKRLQRFPTFQNKPSYQFEKKPRTAAYGEDVI